MIHMTNLSFRKAVSLDLLYYTKYTNTNTMHEILLLCLHELSCLYCVQLGLGLIFKATRWVSEFRLWPCHYSWHHWLAGWCTFNDAISNTFTQHQCDTRMTTNCELGCGWFQEILLHVIRKISTGWSRYGPDTSHVLLHGWTLSM